LSLALGLAAAICAGALQARAFPLEPFSDLVGNNRATIVLPGETLLDVARREDIGQEEIVLANPGLDRWLPSPGSSVLVPELRILPTAERRGLVLNLPELRLYYFPGEQDAAGFEEVMTYPISVGRMDWVTPLGQTRIISKQRAPSWTPPASVREEHAAEGDILPRVIPPGPDNPLGDYAMRLALPGYLIHGTNKPFGVGMRVTHGCVRMLPEDIAQLFPLVPTGTEVQIVNQPVKLGWLGGDLYMEVHPPMEEAGMDADALLDHALDLVYRAIRERPAVIDGAQFKAALQAMDGMPWLISLRASPPPSRPPAGTDLHSP
jgi:L,D-transpeptidase ErfK/SrfK